MKWISTKDQSPNNGDKIVFIKHGSSGSGMMMLQKLFTVGAPDYDMETAVVDSTDGRCRCVTSEYWVYIDKIDYWFLIDDLPASP